MSNPAEETKTLPSPRPREGEKQELSVAERGNKGSRPEANVGMVVSACEQGRNWGGARPLLHFILLQDMTI